MPRIINDGLNKHERYRLKDVEAYRKLKRDYARTPEQRTKRREYMQLWRYNNRTKHNEQARNSHHRNKYKHIEKLRYKRFQKLYGIDREKYNEMYEKQKGQCLICSVTPKTLRLLHVDHDHKTNGIRGLLCLRCNGHLGWFEKYQLEILMYLQKQTSV